MTQTRGALPQLTVKVESWPPACGFARVARCACFPVPEARCPHNRLSSRRRARSVCLKRTKHIPKKDNLKAKKCLLHYIFTVRPTMAALASGRALQDAVSTVMERTHLTSALAVSYLRVADGDVERAIGLFYDSPDVFAEGYSMPHHEETGRHHAPPAAPAAPPATALVPAARRIHSHSRSVAEIDRRTAKKRAREAQLKEDKKQARRERIEADELLHAKLLTLARKQTARARRQAREEGAKEERARNKRRSVIKKKKNSRQARQRREGRR